jgi:hypothetical protein
MPLPAAFVRLPIGEKEAYAFSALKNENGGSEEQRKRPPAGHGLNLQA